MPKNIIICSDGTGNTSVKGRGTNVFKLFEAVDLNGHRTDKHLMPQVAIYDDGVGTEEFKPLKIFAGATGFGLARNVRLLYKSLVRVYDPGDQIFLFGFSRGAFTVRTLGGLIVRCGILDMKRLPTVQALEAAVNATYKTYRKAYRTELAKLVLGPPNLAAIAKFREENCLPGEVPLRFIGVWDTVDAVGTPLQIGDFINVAIHRFKFPDLHLSKSVVRACHALSLDDPRLSFTPVLWDESQEDPASTRISQVWFAGVHSNVGGGYPKQGLSLVPMDWMMWHARKEGLRAVAEDARLYNDHANVDDKLYNPRAGAGMFYRWALRDVTKLCADAKVRPAVHISALERVAHGTEDYAPGNLPPYGEVVFTPTGDPERDKFAKARADHIRQVLRTAHDHESAGQPLLSECAMEVKLGYVSYWIYVLSFVPVVVAVLYACWKAWSLLLAGQGAAQWFSLVRDEFVDNVKIPAIILLVGLLAAWILSRWVMSRMSRKFSGFWHGAQPVLRKRLAEVRNSPSL